jgi:hypothetical protein
LISALYAGEVVVAFDELLAVVAALTYVAVIVPEAKTSLLEASSAGFHVP